MIIKWVWVKADLRYMLVQRKDKIKGSKRGNKKQDVNERRITLEFLIG